MVAAITLGQKRFARSGFRDSRVAKRSGLIIRHQSVLAGLRSKDAAVSREMAHCEPIDSAIKLQRDFGQLSTLQKSTHFGYHPILLG
jgi:hypothetical protein